MHLHLSMFLHLAVGFIDRGMLINYAHICTQMCAHTNICVPRGTSPIKIEKLNFKVRVMQVLL